MPIRPTVLAMLVALSAAMPAFADPAPNAAVTGQAGNWREQKTELVYMGFTATYSCDGLRGKLELLLRQLGARQGFKVAAFGCDRGDGTPSPFARATLEFSTLQPADAADGAAAESGIWRSVELAPHRPFELQEGDCELMEQFRDQIVPLFATRELQSRITCVPHQDTGGPFSVRLQVFAPPTPVKSK